MSLHDLHDVFVSTQNACKSVNACGDLSLPKEFKDSYAGLIKNEQSFSRHNEAAWLANDILELRSRGNRTVTYIPSVFFFVAQKLVPLYLELQAYRAVLVQVLRQYNHTLDDTEEPNCVQYISKATFLSGEERHWLCKFVTDGSWWGKGRQIKRAQDFYESPLMQSASLTQETQSEVARITKQFAENPILVSKLATRKNFSAAEPSNVDRLTVALKLFQEAREATGPNGWTSYDAWAKAARETFAKVDAGMLIAADFDYAEFARKFVYNPTVANAYFKDHDANEKTEVGNFISQNRASPHAASWYLDADNLPQVKGFGSGVALNFMMKVRPNEFATCSGMLDDMLIFVGLLKQPLSKTITIEGYEQNRALQGQVIAKMRELGIGKAADDESAADYLTVNEFAWWLSKEENRNLIKEKIMDAEFKGVSKKPKKDGEKKLSDMMKDPLLQRLAAALRTKPFAILAGHSGTGKSQMVRRLAYMTCADENLMAEAKERNAPGNYCMIQVRPNWHDSTDLLGYYSEMSDKYRTTEFVEFVAKAYAYPDIPFFVCLDEMNLAPVEQYFAEYLSAIESASDKSGEFLTDPLLPKTYNADQVMSHDEVRFTESKAWFEAHGLTIPKNLFVVGTVNMDDTTCQFSRKVLDRAMTIMMDQVNFEDMQKAEKSAEPSEEDLLQIDDITKFLERKLRADPLDDDQVKLLKDVDQVLGKTPFAVAYRFANEYALYEDSLAALTGKTKDLSLATVAMDHCVLMKVLPRVHGEEQYVTLLFKGKDDGSVKGLMSVLSNPDTSSGEKMQQILDRKQAYLSFWP